MDDLEFSQLERSAFRTKAIEFYRLCDILEAKIDGARKALEEISRGAGAFSRDPLEHANNCIESMRETARKALEAL